MDIDGLHAEDRAEQVERGRGRANERREDKQRIAHGPQSSGTEIHPWEDEDQEDAGQYKNDEPTMSANTHSKIVALYYQSDRVENGASASAAGLTEGSQLQGEAADAFADLRLAQARIPEHDASALW